eukprot:RCo025788
MGDAPGGLRVNELLGPQPYGRHFKLCRLRAGRPGGCLIFSSSVWSVACDASLRNLFPFHKPPHTATQIAIILIAKNLRYIGWESRGFEVIFSKVSVSMGWRLFTPASSTSTVCPTLQKPAVFRLRAWRLLFIIFPAFLSIPFPADFELSECLYLADFI